MEKAVITSLNSNTNNEISAVTLSEWCATHYSEEERQSVFMNMDRTLKYIHEHGYCIAVFHPSKIYILNDRDDHIQFKELVELSLDQDTRRQMIQEDIFNSSLIQIGIYSNTLEYMNPEFIREKFDDFTQFIPGADVAYYRGVIQRGASVYYCEYSLEKRKRELDDLESQIGGVSEEEKQKVNTPPSDAELTNKKVNDLIYRQISGLRDTAFINLLIVPLLMVGILIVFMVTTLIISLVG